MAHNLAPYVARGEPSEVMRDLLADGRSVSAVAYLDALARAPRYAAGLADIFDEYDAIVTPAAPAWRRSGLDATGDPAFCTLWTLTGLPALSLPMLTGTAACRSAYSSSVRRASDGGSCAPPARSSRC